jgi:hypothetical protein
MFTWSLGLTGFFSLLFNGTPSSSLARLAITSLTFMLWLVPAPAWNGSTTKWSINLPAITSSAAWMMASARRGSSNPRSRLTSAAARLMAAMLQTKAGYGRRPLTGKLLTARWVCAP